VAREYDFMIVAGLSFIGFLLIDGVVALVVLIARGNSLRAITRSFTLATFLLMPLHAAFLIVTYRDLVDRKQMAEAAVKPR
jgi:hypothetical protein